MKHRKWKLCENQEEKRERVQDNGKIGMTRTAKKEDIFKKFV